MMSTVMYGADIALKSYDTPPSPALGSRFSPHKTTVFFGTPVFASSRFLPAAAGANNIGTPFAFTGPAFYFFA